MLLAQPILSFSPHAVAVAVTVAGWPGLSQASDSVSWTTLTPPRVTSLSRRRERLPLPTFKPLRRVGRERADGRTRGATCGPSRVIRRTPANMLWTRQALSYFQ
ncbi:hypothetical protein BC826DRAFT_1049720 [Russula brevipes]|nr:hypothetical protein BC826DRAFT_1049720 [Russula brevipes]